MFLAKFASLTHFLTNLAKFDHQLEKGLNVAPFLTTHAVKSHIVLGLKSALEHAKVKLLNHEIQKKELLAFEEKGSVNGSFSYSAPSGLHDDCVMALAMVWDACSKMGGSERLIIPASDLIQELEEYCEDNSPDFQCLKY